MLSLRWSQKPVQIIPYLNIVDVRLVSLLLVLIGYLVYNYNYFIIWYISFIYSYLETIELHTLLNLKPEIIILGWSQISVMFYNIFFWISWYLKQKVINSAISLSYLTLLHYFSLLFPIVSLIDLWEIYINRAKVYSLRILIDKWFVLLIIYTFSNIYFFSTAKLLFSLYHK